LCILFENSKILFYDTFMEKFKFLRKEGLNKVPQKCGVYCFSGNKGILYIGKATNLNERIKNHFQQPGFQDNLFLKKVKKIGYVKTDSEIEALIFEASLIKKYQPKFNIMWRDDKNYFFVGVTKEEFPQIFITHQIKLKTDFVGPFIDGTALKETLKFLRKIFPYRSCNLIPKKPCLWYQLSRCPAPCLLKSSLGSQIPGTKIKIKGECQKNVKNILKILRGKRNEVLNDLRREMNLASDSQNFEKAARMRDKIYAMEKTFSHARIFEPGGIIKPKENWINIQKILKEILDVKNEIRRIEAYDVSNIQGELATGSMVVFTNGKPDKNQYRKFKIEIGGRSRTRAKLGAGLTPYRSATGGTGTGPNDTAMLKEILSRRFNHPEWQKPDLILIDGGKPQLNIAVNSKFQNPKSKKVKIITLAKKKNELFIEGREKPILLKTLPREIFNLILQLRDEAHRFAIIYHRKLRKKSLIR